MRMAWTSNTNEKRWVDRHSQESKADFHLLGTVFLPEFLDVIFLWDLRHLAFGNKVNFRQGIIAVLKRSVGKNIWAHSKYKFRVREVRGWEEAFLLGGNAKCSWHLVHSWRRSSHTGAHKCAGLVAFKPGNVARYPALPSLPNMRKSVWLVRLVAHLTLSFTPDCGF